MTPSPTPLGDDPIDQHIGFVVIGRNEGERLIASLNSLGTLKERAVYVDSGSTDGSVAAALNVGATIVELATDIPFTAARARNAGADVLLKTFPETTLIQFLDGDCCLREDWAGAAADFLATHPDVAIVCGRRRERFPERSIYNALCDREWNGPTGSITECGGDFMIRVEAFQAVGGFRAELIAGEEPELCLRLRERGWAIWRLDREMTLHDANITRFGQWWRRQMRAGHAFAEVSWLHRNSPRRIWHRQSRRAVLWGLAIPIAIAALSILGDWRFLFLVLVYPANVIRIALRENARSALSWWSALYAVLGKFPRGRGRLETPCA